MSKPKSTLDSAIDRLEDASDWEEDSSVSVHVHNAPPVKSVRAARAGLLEAFGMLPPWGRVAVVLAVLGCLTGAGLLGRLLSVWVPR